MHVRIILKQGSHKGGKGRSLTIHVCKVLEAYHNNLQARAMNDGASINVRAHYKKNMTKLVRNENGKYERAIEKKIYTKRRLLIPIHSNGSQKNGINRAMSQQHNAVEFLKKGNTKGIPKSSKRINGKRSNHIGFETNSPPSQTFYQGKCHYVCCIV